MKAKVLVPLLLVAVAAVAFTLGWQYRSAQVPAKEVAASQLALATPPAPAVEEPPAIPTPAARTPGRRQPAAKRAASAPTESVVLASTTQPAETPSADTGVPRVETPTVRVAEGTKIAFTLNNRLSTKTNREGDPFSGVVSQSVRVGDKIAIPEGSVVRGSVAHVERAGRVKGRSELGLAFDKLELPDGQTYDLSASLTDLGEGEKETVSKEGQVEGEGTKKRDAATIGSGGGIGAAIGAIAGGGKGTAIGAGAGAAAGTAVVLLTRGKDVELKRGSELALQLDRPLTVRTQ